MVVSFDFRDEIFYVYEFVVPYEIGKEGRKKNL